MQNPSKNSDTLNLFYLLGDYYEDYEAAKQLNWGCNQWRVEHSQTLHGWFIASESGQTAAGRTSCFETMELKDSRYSLFSHFCSGKHMYTQCIHIYYSWRDIPMIYLLLLVRTCPECCWNPHELLAFIHDFSY